MHDCNKYTKHIFFFAKNFFLYLILAKDLFAKVGFVADNLEEKSRKLVITNEELKLKFIIAKTADVPTYVEHGAADIGVIGKDVLMEAQKDVLPH